MKYRVSGIVSISVHVDVEASSKKEAIERAQDAGMQTLCCSCSDGDPDSWSTSGELDGAPKAIRAVVLRGAE